MARKSGRRRRTNSRSDELKERKLAVVIFGASGDLASRKIVPALYSLASQKLLGENYRILGVARSDYTDENFRARLGKGVEKYARIKPKKEQWARFSKHLSYLQGEYNDPGTYRRLKEELFEGGRDGSGKGDYIVLFHASTPPSVYPEIVEQLGEAGFEKNNGSIIIEKPFGRDLETARSLNAKIHGAFDESRVYRIDHYLGKETVQNILTFRFANTIFEPLWNRNYVSHVQIIVAESVGVEHRAGYYERAGVARDMLQNHLLQLVALCAMEPPAAFNEKELRDEKIKVLGSLVPNDSTQKEDNPPYSCVWGQYDGYTEEEGVGKNSRTPTFVALKLYINNWRWQGVPFYLRTGKKLRSKASEIVVQFKSVPLLLFPKDTDVRPNRISICIQPDEGLHLRFETKKPGLEMSTAPVNMMFHYNSRFGEKALVGAYEHLLLDAMHGDPSLFDRADGVELAWAFVDPIISSYEKGGGELFRYRPGSWGPRQADEMTAHDGVSWHADCVSEEEDEEESK